MNNPLNYQITEYDCGPTTLQNALSYLFDRSEIPPEVIKFINLYCMDSYGREGEPCKNGTSSVAMAFLASWINQYGQAKKWPVHLEVLSPEEVFIGQRSRIVAALQQGGAAVLRVMLECGHYVLLTGAEGEALRVFDPYFWQTDFQDGRIKTVSDRPAEMNRLIHWDVFNQDGEEIYSLGPVEKRECVLIFNRVTRRDESSIEYTI